MIPAGAEPEGRAPRVLVAEDNLVNQKVTSKMLEKLGVTCVIAADGKLALEAAAREPFDLILMDCQMPAMDGIEATRELRRSGNRSKIVALTAGAVAGERERCLEAGMDGYLTKPIDFEQLREIVDAARP